MARPVPIGEYEPQVPVEEGLRRIIPSRTPVSIGSGLEDVSRSLDTVAKGQAATYTAQQLSAAQEQWTREFQRRQETAAPGAEGFGESLQNDYSKYVKDAVKGAPNAMAGQLLQRQLQSYGLQLLHHSMQFEADARTAHAEITAKQSVDSAQGELLQHPELYSQRLLERQALINEMNLDPQNKEKLALYAKNNLAAFAVRGDIERDPYKTMLAIQDSKTGYYADLSAEAREQLMDRADHKLHEQVSDAQRIHELAKQQQKETSDNLLRKGIVASQGGQLTAGQVLKWAPLLEPQALKYLLDETSGKNVESDLHTYSDLLTRAGHGEDVSEDAQHALFHGLLSKADYTRVADMGAKDLPNTYRQGDEKIRTALGTSQFEFDPARNQTLANARDDWISWNRDNPKASFDDAQKAYNGIIHRYQIIQSDHATALLSVPEHFVGSKTAPNIPASKQNLYQAFKSGAISRAQFDKEAAILSDWDKAMAYQQMKSEQAKAKAAGQ